MNWNPIDAVPPLVPQAWISVVEVYQRVNAAWFERRTRQAVMQFAPHGTNHLGASLEAVSAATWEVIRRAGGCAILHDMEAHALASEGLNPHLLLEPDTPTRPENQFISLSQGTVGSGSARDQLGHLSEALGRYVLIPSAGVQAALEHFGLLPDDNSKAGENTRLPSSNLLAQHSEGELHERPKGARRGRRSKVPDLIKAYRERFPAGHEVEGLQRESALRALRDSHGTTAKLATFDRALRAIRSTETSESF